MPFLTVPLFITLKEGKNKTLKENALSTEDQEGDYQGKILLCNIKGHKITQCSERRKNSSFVF